MSAWARRGPSHRMQVARVAPEEPASSLMNRRRVMADGITCVGLDVQKDQLSQSV